MNNVTLNNGLQMPQLGLGVFQITDAEEVIHSVQMALKHGYRLIDTAASYLNEEEVGKAIQASEVPREELFITTKLWVQDTGYEATKRAFSRSLHRLGLGYLDLYLIHQPYGDVHGSWRAMEELYKEGKVKAIGVSNFAPDRIMDLMVHNEIKPMVNQIEVNAFHQQNDSVAFHQEHDIHIEAWAPFAEGKNHLFDNEQLQAIAADHQKSVAQVVLRWLLQRDIIVIPKSVNEDRLQQNIDVFDFTLNDQEVEIIQSLNRNESQFFDHRDPQMVKALGERKLDI